MKGVEWLPHLEAIAFCGDDDENVDDALVGEEDDEHLVEEVPVEVVGLEVEEVANHCELKKGDDDVAEETVAGAKE